MISDVAVWLGGGRMGGGGALHRIGDTNHEGTSESTATALCICGNVHIARDRATGVCSSLDVCCTYRWANNRCFAIVALV